MTASTKIPEGRFFQKYPGSLVEKMTKWGHDEIWR
jgi:hypothetical protein